MEATTSVGSVGGAAVFASSRKRYYEKIDNLDQVPHGRRPAIGYHTDEAQWVLHDRDDVNHRWYGSPEHQSKRQAPVRGWTTDPNQVKGDFFGDEVTVQSTAMNGGKTLAPTCIMVMSPDSGYKYQRFEIVNIYYPKAGRYVKAFINHVRNRGTVDVVYMDETYKERDGAVVSIKGWDQQRVSTRNMFSPNEGAKISADELSGYGYDGDQVAYSSTNAQTQVNKHVG